MNKKDKTPNPTKQLTIWINIDNLLSCESSETPKIKLDEVQVIKTDLEELIARGHEVYLISNSTEPKHHATAEKLLSDLLGSTLTKNLVFSRDNSFVNGDIHIDSNMWTLLTSKDKRRICTSSLSIKNTLHFNPAYPKQLDLWFDIDDVILDHTDKFLNLINTYVKDEATRKKIMNEGMSWNFEEVDEETAKKMINSINSEEYMGDSIQFFKGAKESILRYRKLGHNVRFVTALATECREVREKLLIKELGEWVKDNLIFAHNKQFVDGDLFVDDNFNNVSTSKAKTKLLFHRNLLKPIPTSILLNNRITLVHTWKDIDNTVEKMQTPDPHRIVADMLHYNTNQAR